MSQLIQYCMVILLAFSIIGCDSVAKYTIDKNPKVKIDSSLLGIWKVTEDTNKANYILVQTNYDVHNHLENYKPNDYNYYITYMNRSGTNPLYQQWTTFISEVNNNKFLNIGSLNGALKGYFFIKIIDHKKDKITTAMFSDKELGKIKSSSKLRKRIKKNINNVFFYSDTLHFVKVSSFHNSLRESVAVAN